MNPRSPFTTMSQRTAAKRRASLGIGLALITLVLGIGMIVLGICWAMDGMAHGVAPSAAENRAYWDNVYHVMDEDR